MWERHTKRNKVRNRERTDCDTHHETRVMYRRKMTCEVFLSTSCVTALPHTAPQCVRCFLPVSLQPCGYRDRLPSCPVPRCRRLALGVCPSASRFPRVLLRAFHRARGTSDCERLAALAPEPLLHRQRRLRRGGRRKRRTSILMYS